ncbi:hypothetical protein AC579_2988 [Pseudocercospora musae]|uniref:Uncharacterized protein n=1 Tax=Pseudocercospora musae TaxID=113226 RepID=A0A139GWB2_9PEZI|nr:hypothetical protein AC579_2988 [Pseudocercospora musae]
MCRVRYGVHSIDSVVLTARRCRGARAASGFGGGRTREAQRRMDDIEDVRAMRCPEHVGLELVVTPTCDYSAEWYA